MLQVLNIQVNNPSCPEEETAWPPNRIVEADVSPRVLVDSRVRQARAAMRKML